MTGDEAWKIVGPILAAMLLNAKQWNQELLGITSDAYITTYLALKQYGNGEEKKNDKN